MFEQVYALCVAVAAHCRPGDMLVIGASTSEIAGERIGTQGSVEIAQDIVKAVERCAHTYGVHVAYQCCEHLNRALVVCGAVACADDVVTVVPVPEAGGALAAVAYETVSGATVVERIQAHAGIDIGQTLIGMHIRPVAVPLRVYPKTIGCAIVTAATSRPKLIGGARAVYSTRRVTDERHT